MENLKLGLREKERETLLRAKTEADFYKSYDKIVVDRAWQNPPNLSREIKGIFDTLFPKTGVDD